MTEIVDHLIAAACWCGGGLTAVIVVLMVALFIVGWRDSGPH